MNKQDKRIAELRTELLHGIGVPEAQEFKPDEFQLQAIQSLEEGFDTLVIAPTGTGKTYIAVEGIRRTIESGQRAIYTAPLKALSNTKYAEFKRLFEPKYRVGLLTGDRKIDGDADVVVATTEIYRNDLYSYGESYSLVVLDELHYLSDPQRGPVWEESIILSAPNARLLMLSASISNPETVASWIEETRGAKVRIIVEEERPVEMRLGFLHPSHGIIPLEEEKGILTPEIRRFYASSRNDGPKRGRRKSASPRGRSRGKNAVRGKKVDGKSTTKRRSSKKKGGK
jgi:superfamily II RNA helicase